MFPRNPFDKQSIRPHSLFDENPFDPSEGIDVDVKNDLDEKFIPREYLGILMNYETRVFFEDLVRQLGEEEVKNVLGMMNTEIQNGALLKLNCSFCPNLKELKGLPPSLTMLICSACSITELNNLPPSLTVLYCSHCPISELKDLPLGLTDLYCTGCPFTENPTEYAALKAKYPNVTFYS